MKLIALTEVVAGDRSGDEGTRIEVHVAADHIVSVKEASVRISPSTSSPNHTLVSLSNGDRIPVWETLAEVLTLLNAT